MFHNFHNQVAEIFFMNIGEAAAWIFQRLSKFTAAKADMGSVISQTDVGSVGKRYEIFRDDARFPASPAAARRSMSAK